jgi:hypothetical protein
MTCMHVFNKCSQNKGRTLACVLQLMLNPCKPIYLHVHAKISFQSPISFAGFVLPIFSEQLSSCSSRDLRQIRILLRHSAIDAENVADVAVEVDTGDE